MLKYFSLSFLALFFAVFLIYPLVYLIEGAFVVHGHFSPGVFYLLLASQLFYSSLVNSLVIGLVTTLCTSLIAVPLALLFSRYRFPGQAALQLAMLIPLILPPFVGAIGLKHLFSRFGLVNLVLGHLGIVPLSRTIDWFGGGGMSGVILLEVLHLFPILFMSATASIGNLDQSLLDAAANLGASPWRRFRTITLPICMPGFFAGASIIFISAFTDLGTPLVFNLTTTVPAQIFFATTNAATEQAGYALVVITLVLVAGFFLLVRRFGEGSHSLTRPGTTTPQHQLRGYPAFLASSLVCILVFMAVLPHLGVILTSFAKYWFFTVLPSRYTVDFYGEVFSSPITRQCAVNSIFYSGLSAGFDLILGLIIAQLLAREKFVGKSILDVLTMLPLAVPGLVLAFGLLKGFDLSGPFGWMNPRNDPTFLLVMSYSLRRLPYIVRSAFAGYQALPLSMEEASYNLGASRITTVRRIVLPLLAPSLIAGTILTFCYSMLEVSDSLILAQLQRYAPITRGIYNLLSRPSPDSPALACAFGVLAMVLLAFGLLASSTILGKKFNSLFKM